MQLHVVQFDRSALLVDPAGPGTLLRHLRDTAVTDLLVFAHGGCRNLQDARDRAGHLAATLRTAWSTLPPWSSPRTFALALIAWPSRASLDPEGERAPGVHPLTEALDAFREWLGPGAEAEIAELTRLSRDLESLPEARDSFAQHATTLFARAVGGDRGTTLPLVPEEDPPALATLTGQEMFERLLPPVPHSDPGLSTAPAPSPAPFTLGARRLLDFGAAYALRVLAGQIGEKGLAPLLQQWAADLPSLRFHLCGHGFGARLVIAAAQAADDPPVETLTLLQAAVSQFAFTANVLAGQDGAFRRVVAHRRIRGPILVTRSQHDAVLIRTYALASRLAAPSGAGSGSFASLYGALGTHGARKLGAAEHASGLLGDPHFIAAHSHLALLNLHGDAQIRRHDDVTGPAIANAILTAIRGTA